MLTIIPHEALEDGANLNIIGEKLGLIDKNGTKAAPQQPTEQKASSDQNDDDDTKAKQEYE